MQYVKEVYFVSFLFASWVYDVPLFLKHAVVSREGVRTLLDDCRNILEASYDFIHAEDDLVVEHN